MNVSCGTGAPGSECGDGFSDPSGYAAVVYLFAADILLEQAAGPSAGAVGGELATAATLAGTSDLSFTASDPGSGVYEAQFTLDGRLVQSTVLNENGGRCRQAGVAPDGSPAFLYLRPCLPSLSADVGFDTTAIPDGSHHLLVTVTDPAGNSAPVLDREITVANPLPPGSLSGSAASAPAGGPGAPNGVNASTPALLRVAWKGAAGATLVSAFGRSHVIAGRLTTPAGVPIAGAQLEVRARPSYSGAVAAAMPSLATAADGTFTLRVPASASSRTIAFSYRAHVGDPLPAASASLSLTVRAGLSLGVSPRVSAAGHRIFFNGRLGGAPYPAAGKLLVLEARSARGPWIKFDVVRSGRSGRFHASYRFRFPGPARYTFRVVSEPEGDYPYAAGASNTVAVRER